MLGELLLLILVFLMLNYLFWSRVFFATSKGDDGSAGLALGEPVSRQLSCINNRIVHRIVTIPTA